MTINLDRFLKAQNQVYLNALLEIKNGRKRSHWMWYVFPQIAGLGNSETSKYYSIQNLGEAAAFLKHPVLGQNLREISLAILGLESLSAYEVLGSPDDLKLHSCITLFAEVCSGDKVFGDVIDKYFDGKADKKTLDILGNMRKKE